MVFSRNIKQIVKKKYSVPQKDKKDWMDFTKKMDNIFVKEDDFLKEVPNQWLGYDSIICEPLNLEVTSFAKLIKMVFTAVFLMPGC